MTAQIAEARQAWWMEKDDQGRVVSCATNAVGLVNPSSVFFLRGRQDMYKSSDWSQPPAHLPVVVLFRDRPEIEAFEREHAAFQKQLPSLTEKFPGQFVAVRGGLPVDSDISRARLVRRFFEKFGDSPVYIGYAGEEPTAYQVTPLPF